MKPLIAKHEFIGLEQCAWLYNGAETPPHRGVMQAMQDYVMARSLGPRGREQHTRVEQQCRANIADLLHGQSQDIALLSNASEAITAIAQSLDFQEGDNIVINTLEFPSGVYPWLMLQARGVEVRRVEHRDWHVSVDDILNAVDERTKLVMTSHVSFVSGARLDYRTLYRELQETETLLLLDVTQSLGTMPVYMYEADIVVSSSYKWLLSVHGLGILGINPKRLHNFLPAAAGWRSVTDLFTADRFLRFTFAGEARRFELGYPSYPTIYTLAFTSALLRDIGVGRIEEYILHLGQYLIEQLHAKGYTVMTSMDPQCRGGNISFQCAQAEETAERLLQEGVYVWGGDGRIRASIHLFNDRDDIDRLIGLL